jgi:hypothetical protein
MTDQPRTGPRHEPERIYERAADPAEAVNRPLEPKAPHDPLLAADEPDDENSERPEPHHRLSTPVGEPDPTADSDPYARRTEDDDADRASGTTGSHQGAEESR